MESSFQKRSVRSEGLRGPKLTASTGGCRAENWAQGLPEGAGWVRDPEGKDLPGNVPRFQGSQTLLHRVPMEHLAFRGTTNQADSAKAKGEQLQRTPEAISSGPFFQAAINGSWIFKTLQLDMQLVLPA